MNAYNTPVFKYTFDQKSIQILLPIEYSPVWNVMECSTQATLVSLIKTNVTTWNQSILSSNTTWVMPLVLHSNWPQSLMNFCLHSTDNIHDNRRKTKGIKRVQRSPAVALFSSGRSSVVCDVGTHVSHIHSSSVVLYPYRSVRHATEHWEPGTK